MKDLDTCEEEILKRLEEEKMHEYLHLALEGAYVDDCEKTLFKGKICKTTNSFGEQAKKDYDVELYKERNHLICVNTIDTAQRGSFKFDIINNEYIEIIIKNENDKEVEIDLNFKSDLRDICIFKFMHNKKVKVNLPQYSKQIIIDTSRSATFYLHDGELLFTEVINQIYNKWNEDVKELCI